MVIIIFIIITIIVVIAAISVFKPGTSKDEMARRVAVREEKRLLAEEQENATEYQIAGINYVDLKESEFGSFSGYLINEPENIHDSNAVAVYAIFQGNATEEKRVGYISAALNRLLHKRLLEEGRIYVAGEIFTKIDSCSDRPIQHGTILVTKSTSMDTTLNNWRSEAYYEADSDKQIELYSKILKFADTDASTYCNRGIIYSRRQEYDKAIEDYNRAIESDPNNDRTYYGRGNVYFYKNEYNKAIKINPNYGSVYCNRGCAYDELKDYNRAVANYKILIELCPDDASAYNNMAWSIAQLEDDRLNEALSYINKAIEINSTDDEYLQTKKEIIDKIAEKTNKISDNMNFVAIDFETATSKRDSACALAMVVVESGKIVAEHSFLIKPPHNEYSYMNIGIHGIRAADTHSEMTIAERYQFIFDILNGANVVAHNSSFDISVLKASLGYYGLEMPTPSSVCCTYRMSGYALNVCCRNYGIDLNHHEALSDARACAQIYLKLCEVGITMPTPKKRVYTKNKLIRTPINCDSIDNKKTVFYGKSVVITGVFETYERIQIADAVQILGGVVKSSISKNTDILICGNNCGPAKLAKITQLREDGIKDIQIINEYSLREVLSQQ